MYQQILEVSGVDRIEKVLITLDKTQFPACQDVPIKAAALVVFEGTRSNGDVLVLADDKRDSQFVLATAAGSAAAQRSYLLAAQWPRRVAGGANSMTLPSPATISRLLITPGSGRLLTEPSGSFGGLVPPGNAAVGSGRQPLSARRCRRAPQAL